MASLTKYLVCYLDDQAVQPVIEAAGPAAAALEFLARHPRSDASQITVESIPSTAGAPRITHYRACDLYGKLSTRGQPHPPRPAAPPPVDDHWLEGAVIACPGCGCRLFSVIHSPFFDCHRLYCNRCPRAVEVGYYDPVYRRIINALPAGCFHPQRMAAIELRLQPCVCGGSFRDAAARRCFTCEATVPRAGERDLYPFIEGIDGRGDDPSPEEQAAFDRFETAFIRKMNLWSDERSGTSTRPRIAGGS